MSKLTKAAAILRSVMAAEPNPHPGCDKCHGEPFVHTWTDTEGRAFSARCDCPLGIWLAAHDRMREPSSGFRPLAHQSIRSDGTEPSGATGALEGLKSKNVQGSRKPTSLAQ